MSSANTENIEISYPEKRADNLHPINPLIARRWSPRLFDEGRAVEHEKLLSLLEAARWAPSCFNDQPWYYLVFDGSNPDALERARGCLVEGNAWARRAPLLLLSVARENFSHSQMPNRHAQHDTGAASAYLVLQAVELGLITHQMAGFDSEKARAEFHIPEGYTPMAMMAIGYPYENDLNNLDEKTRTRELAGRSRRLLRETAFVNDWGMGVED
jgi:nitroreductase